MNRIRISLLIAAGLALAAPAQADFFDSLYQGAQLFATPSGGPLGGGPGGARSNGTRIGRVRIVPNRAGNGHRLEFDRNFGRDSLGRPEVLDLGNFELQLSGTLSTTLSYTKRGIPTARSEFNTNQLNYIVRGKPGFQDFELSGTLDVGHEGELTPLGFYTASVSVNNTDSALDFEGLVVDGDIDTDYDVGPINIRGNIYFDAIVAALASFGVDTTGLEGIFPKSPIDRITEEIRTTLGKQAEALTSRIAAEGVEDVAALAAEADDQIVDLGLTLDAAQDGASSRVPEPGTLLLMALGCAAALRARRT